MKTIRFFDPILITFLANPSRHRRNYLRLQDKNILPDLRQVEAKFHLDLFSKCLIDQHILKNNYEILQEVILNNSANHRAEVIFNNIFI